MVVGEPFLSFQWDILLTETLLLSLPFLPTVRFHRFGSKVHFSKWARVLIVALLAKLMLESGIVKFTSFAETEPIPGEILPLLIFITGRSHFLMRYLRGFILYPRG